MFFPAGVCLPFDIISHSVFIKFVIISSRHFLPFDVLSLSVFITFVLMSFRHYVPFDVLSFRRFLPFDVFSFDLLSHSMICPSTFFNRRLFVLRRFAGESVGWLFSAFVLVHSCLCTLACPAVSPPVTGSSWSSACFPVLLATSGLPLPAFPPVIFLLEVRPAHVECLPTWRPDQDASWAAELSECSLELEDYMS
jgi:hypothetical protein